MNLRPYQQTADMKNIMEVPDESLGDVICKARACDWIIEHLRYHSGFQGWFLRDLDMQDSPDGIADWLLGQLERRDAT